MSVLKIHEQDNVVVALTDIKAGQDITVDDRSIMASQAVSKGHKIAVTDIKTGENVVKYGFAIGHATADIKRGEWIHTHNVKTNLGKVLEYRYQPTTPLVHPAKSTRTFQGYKRANGKVGVRNEIWIIPTVSCVNRTIQLLAQIGEKKIENEKNIDGCFAFTHPYGCSQLGEDQLATQHILANLVNHPNAGAVLVVSLGCENNNLNEFKKVLGHYDEQRVKFLITQDVEDEIEVGSKLLTELIQYAAQERRTSCPINQLVVGLKCGGSDGFSGITANPLLGSFSDALIAAGGSTVLTEVPEMFGAETILMNRAKDQQVFEKTVALINNFKKYFTDHKQTIYENPSPGNKKGGISTLEDKSLGCTQKGGRAAVVDVLEYGGKVKQQGLTLLSGPGNDAVSTTALAAAGCHLILFTTGRGTPLGTAIPTLKVATNSDLFQRKRNWMDFNAGELLAGCTMPALTEQFINKVLAVASGNLTQSEKMGFREITIFKNGVTL